MGKQLTTEEVKKMNIDILSVVADFCEKNGLRYWLYYGTLIGAIRHNGYIPWDDDIDIIMPRPDYEKFLKSFNQTSGSKYQVIEDRITPGYHNTFAKVHNPKTIIESEFSNKMAFGVFIDIFPFDGVKDAKQSKCAIIILKLLSAKDNKWWRKRKLISNIGLYVFKIIMLPIPVNYLLNRLRKICLQASFDESEYVNYIPARAGMRTNVKRSDLEGSNVEYHIYEGKKYRIPHNYDVCLRKNYGDYMSLPPKEEQVGHPQIAYWK